MIKRFRYIEKTSKLRCAGGFSYKSVRFFVPSVEPHIGPEQEKGHRKLLKGPDHHYFEDEELSSWPSHQDQINREGRLWGGPIFQIYMGREMGLVKN